MWSVCVQHELAGLFQVQLAALQKLLTLGSRPQTQTKQLLRLQYRQQDDILCTVLYVFFIVLCLFWLGIWVEPIQQR